MAEDGRKYSFKVEEDGLIVLDTKAILSADLLKEILIDAEPILAVSIPPIRVLLRATGTGPPDPSGIKAAADFMQQTYIDKIATYTELPDRLYASKMSHIQQEGNEKFKLFRSEEDARVWLRENPTN